MPNSTIFYDHTCPLCRWYTREFVRFDLLQPNGRVRFTDLETSDVAGRIDLARGRHEIPLVDHATGTTHYGVDALVHLLAARLPWLPRVVRFGPIDWFVRRLYKLVSYNRRTIAPSVGQPTAYDCTPDFNWKYRLTYVLLAAGTALWLLPAVLLLVPLLALLGGLLVRGAEARLEALGQVTTAALVGALLWLLLAWITPMVQIPVGIFMIGDVLRRGRIFRKNHPLRVPRSL